MRFFLLALIVFLGHLTIWAFPMETNLEISTSLQSASRNNDVLLASAARRIAPEELVDLRETTANWASRVEDTKTRMQNAKKKFDREQQSYALFHTYWELKQKVRKEENVLTILRTRIAQYERAARQDSEASTSRARLTKEKID